MISQLKTSIRRFIIRLLQVLGYDFDKISLEGALDRCRHRHQVNSVIDIGASNGMWTKKCLKAYPKAQYLLIDAQQPHEDELKAFTQKNANLSYVLTAAGDRDGEIYFDNSLLLGGLASETPFPQNNIVVPVSKIDTLVEKNKLPPPYLLKLDTHGYEIPIFNGAKNTLKQTSLIVVETYNFTVAENSLKFHEMCQYMEDIGFRCVDICDPLHRLLDRTLWQFDLFFARIDDATFSSDKYE
ncbi:MAG: FkbM family methyltransferase [Cellvibrionaceae bacterium]|jgi:FkbM family methyltransferase